MNLDTTLRQINTLAIKMMELQQDGEGRYIEKLDEERKFGMMLWLVISIIELAIEIEISIKFMGDRAYEHHIGIMLDQLDSLLYYYSPSKKGAPDEPD